MTRLERFVPAVGWLRHYRRPDLRPDLAAGLTVGAMLVPQGMAYAQLAGLPPQVGLYSVTVPLIVYALLGTSRQLAVGPVAVVSLLTASALAPIAEQGTTEYLKAAALLALLVGLLNLALGAARTGWVTNLLSHPALVGYTAAAAVIIAVSQLKYLLGVSIPRTDAFLDTVGELWGVLGEFDMLTLAVGLTALATMMLLKRWKRTFPGALVVVAAAVVASVGFDFARHGVAVVGDIPGGLPAFALPTMDGSVVGRLLPAAIVITLVGYAESYAVAKVYAKRNRYDVDPNQELVALGAANVAAGVFSGQPVTGGFARTAVNAASGARTPLASMVSAGLNVVVLLFFTGLFTELPQTVLAAVVIAAVIGLVDLQEMRHIARVKRSDLVTLLVTLAGTLVLGVELGIVVAVVASLAVVVVRLMNPHSAELGLLPDGLYRNIERYPHAERIPGVAILRIDVSLNFANVAFLKRRLRELERDHPEGLQTIVLDGSGINDIDGSAEAALADLVDEYESRGILIHLASMKGPVRDVLQRSGLWDRLADRIHPTIPKELSPR